MRLRLVSVLVLGVNRSYYNYGFSKRVENHGHAVALHFMYYNFVRIHKTLRVTPAMEAGLCDHAWTIVDICSLVKPKASSAAISEKAMLLKALGDGKNAVNTVL